MKKNQMIITVKDHNIIEVENFDGGTSYQDITEVADIVYEWLENQTDRLLDNNTD